MYYCTQLTFYVLYQSFISCFLVLALYLFMSFSFLTSSGCTTTCTALLFFFYQIYIRGLAELEKAQRLTGVCLLCLCVSLYTTTEAKNPTKFDSLLLIIIGGVAGLLVVILVIVVITVNRHHKKRNKKLVMELDEKK